METFCSSLSVKTDSLEYMAGKEKELVYRRYCLLGASNINSEILDARSLSVFFHFFTICTLALLGQSTRISRSFDRKMNVLCGIKCREKIHLIFILKTVVFFFNMIPNCSGFRWGRVNSSKAGTVLCFGFSMRLMLRTPWCFGYCLVVLTQTQRLFSAPFSAVRSCTKSWKGAQPEELI